MALISDGLLRTVRQTIACARASCASSSQSRLTSLFVRQLHRSSTTRASYRRFGEAQYASGGASRSIIPGNSFAARAKNLPPVVYVAVAAGGVYYVYHLERTETGRLRFMDVTEISERQMGDMATQEILTQYGNKLLPENHPTTRYVRKVADRILAASGLDSSTHGQGALREISDRWSSSERKQGVDWKVRVISDDTTRNAFVLPNGAIFVFTGILPICANEDGLAAVLGHEVAHQVARHAGEKMSSQKVYSALSWGALLLGVDPSITSPAIGLLLTLPNSRAAESEADHIGLKLASRACYNAAEAVNMWKRMQAVEGSGGMSVGFLSTHPPNETRIKQITKWLPEVDRIRADSCGETGSFARGFNAVAANFR